MKRPAVPIAMAARLAGRLRAAAARAPTHIAATSPPPSASVHTAPAKSGAAAPGKPHQRRWLMSDILSMGVGVVVGGAMSASYNKTMLGAEKRQ